MITVAVGSTNPTKITPVGDIFRLHFPDVEIRGVEVDSGVPDQPKGDDQIYTGCLNRANGAIRKVAGAEYGVGIEGGLVKRSYGWFEFSLVVIVNNRGEIGIGSSGGLVLPDRIIKLIESGMTLETAIDAVFGTEKIGRGIGMFGIMTNGTVTRSDGVSHGVAFALARFLHRDIYSPEQ
jgi:inosine/xanthosine triphosphatase